MLGVFLIYSGIVTLSSDDDEDMSEFCIVRMFRLLLGDRQLQTYDPDGAMFVRDEEGRLCVTMLMPALIALEVADILFAMDSLSAKIAQMNSMDAAFSSSAFAMFALRALYFVLCDLAEYFDHLKYGISVILIFLGVEMLAQDYYHVSSAHMCQIIVAIFLTCIVTSIVSAMWQ
jgi:tellurite resistance protein TerC